MSEKLLLSFNTAGDVCVAIDKSSKFRLLGTPIFSTNLAVH